MKNIRKVLFNRLFQSKKNFSKNFKIIKNFSFYQVFKRKFFIFWNLCYNFDKTASKIIKICIFMWFLQKIINFTLIFVNFLEILCYFCNFASISSFGDTSTTIYIDWLWGQFHKGKFHESNFDNCFWFSSAVLDDHAWRFSDILFQQIFQSFEHNHHRFGCRHYDVSFHLVFAFAFARKRWNHLGEFGSFASGARFYIRRCLYGAFRPALCKIF